MEAHQRYTRMVNFNKGWKGYLWQGRFASFPMDEQYLLAAVRYVELNPVRARLVRRAEDYPWSSARAHLAGKDDSLVKVEPMLNRVSNWAEFLAQGDDTGFDHVRKHERTGRPPGDETRFTVTWTGRRAKEARAEARQELSIVSPEFRVPGISVHPAVPG